MLDDAAVFNRWITDFLGDSQTQTNAKDWIAQSQGSCLTSIARDFLRSPSVQVRLVEWLYHRFLGRQPEASGMAYWVENYSKADDILHCVRAFIGSTEFFEEQAGGNASLFCSRMLRTLNCSDLGLDEAAMEAAVTTTSPFEVVQNVIVDPQVRLRFVTSLACGLGLADLDAEEIARLTVESNAGTLIEDSIAKLISHPRYIETARGGLNSKDIHIMHLAELAGQLLGIEETVSSLSLLKLREDIGARFPDRVRIQSYWLDFLNQPDVFTKLLSAWIAPASSDAKMTDLVHACAARGFDNPTSTPSVSALSRPVFVFLSDILPIFVETSGDDPHGLSGSGALAKRRLDGAILTTEHSAVLHEVSISIVERWMNLYGRFSAAIGSRRSDVIAHWSRRLNENEGILATFCEFVLSPVCSGCDFSLWGLEEEDVNDPAGCFALRGPEIGKETRQARQPLVATSFFYWYDVYDGQDFIACPDTLQNSPGEDSLTQRPSRMEDFSYKSFAWFARELKDMADAGINVVLPVAYTTPYSDFQSLTNENDRKRCGRTLFADSGLRTLRRSWLDLAQLGLPVPGIAMFYDTTTLNHVNAKGLKIDFSKRYAFRWFYESIRNFFSHFPYPMWARFHGRPIIFVYHPCFGSNLNDGLYPYVRRCFLKDFGVDPYIITAAEEEAPRVLNSDRLQTLADRLLAEPGRDVLADFLSGEEAYLAMGGTDTKYATTLVRRLLGRAPTDMELATYLAMLRLDGQETHLAAPTHQPLHRKMCKWLKPFFWPRDDIANSIPQSGVTAARRDSRHAMVRYILHSELFFTATLENWFQRFFRTYANPNNSIHLDLIANLQSSLSTKGDWLGAMAIVASSPLFYDAAGGGNEYFVAGLYQCFAWKHPNPNCTPNYHTVYANEADKEDFLKLLRQEPRETAVRAFMDKYEVREAVVSAWFFDYLGWYNPGPADTTFYWSGAISPTIRGVASIGPGYDQSKLKNRPPLQMPRFDGHTYESVWRWILAMKPRPEIVHLETWNELFEGTAICNTAEFGRTYIDLTRRFTDEFLQSS